MTREEQTEWLCRLRADLNNGVIFTPWEKEFTEALTGILEQQPCDDVVSRQSAISAVKKNTIRLSLAEEQGCEGHVLWSAKVVPSDAIECC